MKVYLKSNELGEHLGPNFSLLANIGSISPSSINIIQLLNGIDVEVNENASEITITSIEICNNSIVVPIIEGCYHQILDSLATVSQADGSRGSCRFVTNAVSLSENNLTRIGFKFGPDVRIKNASIITDMATFTFGVAANFNLVKYFASHDLTITNDGIGRSGYLNIGGGWALDTCGFWLDIPASNITNSRQIIVDYEFIGLYPSKHGVGFWDAITTAGQGPNENYFGTWDNTYFGNLPNATIITPIIDNAIADIASNILCRRRVIIQNNTMPIVVL